MTRAEGLPLQVKGSIVGSRSRSFRGIDRWLCDLVLVVHKDAPGAGNGLPLVSTAPIRWTVHRRGMVGAWKTRESV